MSISAHSQNFAAAAVAAQAATVTPAPLTSPVVGDVLTNPSAVIHARVGQMFLIALDANRTTGYTWQATSSGAPVVTLVGSAYETPESTRLGAGGRQLYIVRAAAAGTASLTFRYVRPFDKNTLVDAKSITFRIEIEH